MSAYLRQRAIAGVTAVLRRRGAAEAGAIFIKVDRLDGTARLYAPAPPMFGGAIDDTGDGAAHPSTGRHFELVMDAEPLAIEDRMAREVRFDADLWLVEVEDRSGSLGL